MRTYLGNGAGMLVPSNSIDSFLDALQLLRSHALLRDTMGLSARRRAEQLGWPLLARECEDLYTKVLAR